MNAMFQALGYNTYPSPKPSVSVIKVVMPDITGLTLLDGKVNDLYIYFMRPDSLHALTYQEFYEQYRRGTSPIVSSAPKLKIKFVIKSSSSDSRIEPVAAKAGTDCSSHNEADGDRVYDSDDELFLSNSAPAARDVLDKCSIHSDDDDGYSSSEDSTCSSRDDSSNDQDDTLYTKSFRLSGQWVHYELMKRVNTRSLVRIDRVPLKCGEIAYLRMLLLTNPNDANTSIPNRTPTSYSDLRTINGTKYRTFQEAAIAYGICKDPAYVTELVKDICLYTNSPEHRRIHFAILTKEDYPTLHIVNNFDYDDRKKGKIYRSLVEDWILEHKGDTAQSIIKNKFLLELHSYISEDMGYECLKQFGFPTPRGMRSELDMEYAKYDKESQAKLYDTLEEKLPNTVEQQLFLDWFKRVLKDSVENDPDSERDPIFCYIQGSGGTGKSEMLKKLAAYVRSLGLICKMASATGLSASIFDDCSTFHSLFKIGVVEDFDRDYEYELPELNLTKQRIELLKATKVAILDELPFTHKVYLL